METRKFNPAEHLIKLKGKDYLEVKWRLVWFREEHPDWAITTLMTDHDKENKHCIFKATIADETGRVVSQGTGSESIKDFTDYIEKAETKAVGRALAMMGYGTQFAPELEEGERIVDAPVESKERLQLLKAIAAMGVDPRKLDASCKRKFGAVLKELTTEQLVDVKAMLTVGTDESKERGV